MYVINLPVKLNCYYKPGLLSISFQEKEVTVDIITFRGRHRGLLQPQRQLVNPVPYSKLVNYTESRADVWIQYCKPLCGGRTTP